MCPSYDEGMSKVMDARYDAKENVFRLEEKPEGVSDHEMVSLRVVPRREPAAQSLSGSLSREGAEEMARLIDEMFPIER